MDKKLLITILRVIVRGDKGAKQDLLNYLRILENSDSVPGSATPTFSR